jgi:hypothetical protein
MFRAVVLCILAGRYQRFVKNYCAHVRYEVLTAAAMKLTVFWIAKQGSLVEVYRCFAGACCLLHQGYKP